MDWCSSVASVDICCLKLKNMFLYGLVMSFSTVPSARTCRLL